MEEVQTLRELKAENEKLKREINIAKTQSCWQKLNSINDMKRENEQLINELKRTTLLNEEYSLPFMKNNEKLKKEIKQLKKEISYAEKLYKSQIVSLNQKISKSKSIDRIQRQYLPVTGTVFFLNYFESCDEDVKDLKERFNRIGWKCIKIEEKYIKYAQDFNFFLNRIKEQIDGNLIIFFFFGFGDSNGIILRDEKIFTHDYCEHQYLLDKFYKSSLSGYVSYEDINAQFTKVKNKPNSEIILFANILSKGAINRAIDSAYTIVEEKKFVEKDNLYYFIAQMDYAYGREIIKGMMVPYLTQCINVWPKSFRHMARELESGLTQYYTINIFKYNMLQFCYWNAPKYKDVFFPSLLTDKY